MSGTFSLQIGGYVRLDLLHDTDAIASEAQFITSTIVTRDATKAEGSDGQTNFSVNTSRLYFETRTPIRMEARGMVDHVSGILKRTKGVVVLAIAAFILCTFAPPVSAETVEEGPLKKNGWTISVAPWGPSCSKTSN